MAAVAATSVVVDGGFEEVLPVPEDAGVEAELTPPPPPQAASRMNGMIATHARAAPLCLWIAPSGECDRSSIMSSWIDGHSSARDEYLSIPIGISSNTQPVFPDKCFEGELPTY
jgi:hypothetical protein